MSTVPEKRVLDQLSIINPLDIREINDNAPHFMDQAVQYQELMMMYECAIKEVRTKLEVLNAEFSVRYQRNPIEFISCRIKTPASIVKKLHTRNLPVTIEALRENALNDIAGVRVICSFIDDIYAIASMLVDQDDITLIEQKDYIQHPKKNGYRSLHLIVEIPVFFSDQKRSMRVEVQIRTIAMDFWASLEHQLKYKQETPDEESIIEELRQCADIISSTDQRMLEIRNRIHQADVDPLLPPNNTMMYLERFGRRMS